jgi:hypothetical protein
LPPSVSREMSPTLATVVSSAWRCASGGNKSRTTGA